MPSTTAYFDPNAQNHISIYILLNQLTNYILLPKINFYSFSRSIESEKQIQKTICQEYFTVTPKFIDDFINLIWHLQYNIMSIAQRKYPRDQLVTSIIMPDSPPLNNKSQVLYEQPETKPPKELIPINSDHNNEPYLYEQLKRSQKQTTFAQRQLIQQQMTLLETKVHDLEGGEDQNTALGNIYRNSVGANQHVDDGIQDIVRKVSDKVADGLTEKVKPLRTIPKTKDDIKQLQQVDKYRMLKIKNGQIKNKVGDLRHELQKQYFQRRASMKLPDHENVRESDYYNINNPRTQQANQFVHQIQRKRNQEKERYMEYLERKKYEMEHRKEEELERKKAEAGERKQRLEEIFREKQLKKQMQQEEHIKKKEQYKNWSKIFSKQKPLYLKKQEQFIQKSLIPQLYNRRDKLLQIKLQRRPIDINQINDHEQRYLEYKRDDEIRAQAQREEMSERMHMNKEELKNLYKGKYRYIALEEMMNQRMKNSEDPRDLEREKKARQIVYADQIKEKLHEEIKLKQLQTLNLEKKTFTKRTRNIDGSTSMDLNDETKMSSFTDPKADGKKNLHYLHELVRQKGIKRDRPIIRLVQQKNVYPDYLEQMHDKRRKSLNLNHSSILQQSTDSRSKGTPKLESLIAKERSLRQKVRRAQMRKKYNSLDYKQDASIEEHQIDSIRLKMKLINEVN